MIGLPIFFVLITVPFFLVSGNSNDAFHTVLYSVWIHFVHSLQPTLAWLLVFIPWGVYAVAYSSEKLLEWMFNVSLPEFPPSLQSPDREPNLEIAPTHARTFPRQRRAHSAPATVRIASNTDAPHDLRRLRKVDQDWQMVGLSSEPAAVHTENASPPNSHPHLPESEPSTMEDSTIPPPSTDALQSDLE